MIFSFAQLTDKYHEFVTDLEREQLISKLQEVEDWLYEDGEDETKGVYVAKLEELKKVMPYFFRIILGASSLGILTILARKQEGDPIEERFKEHVERGSVIDQLVYCINSYREAAMSNDPKFDHIDLSEKQKV